VDWRYLLASPQFRRLFSDESKKSTLLLLFDAAAVLFGFGGSGSEMFALSSDVRLRELLPEG
jgi:hypothetical protein